MLSNGLYFDDDQVTKFKQGGFDVGYVDELYDGSNVTVNYKNNKNVTETFNFSNIVLKNSGWYIIADSYFKSEYEGTATLSYNVVLSSGTVSGTKEISTENSKIIGGYKKVTSLIRVDNSIESSINLLSVTLNLENFVKSETCDIGDDFDAGVNVFKVYDGMHIPSSSSDGVDTIVNLDDLYVTSTSDGSIPSSAKLKDTSTSWYVRDTSKDGFFEETYENSIDYDSNGSMPILEADAYFASSKYCFALDGKSSFNAGGSPYTFFNISRFFARLFYDDGTSSISKVNLTSTALMDCTKNDYMNAGLSSVDSEAYKKVHIRLELNDEEVLSHNKISKIVMGFGSDVTSSGGFIGIANAKLNFGSSEKGKNNAIFKRIDIDGKSVKSIYYDVKVGKKVKGSVYNISFASGTKGGMYDTVISEVSNSVDYKGNVSEELILKKSYLVPSFIDEDCVPWITSRGNDNHYYYVTLKNNSPFEKDVNLVDYSLYAGNYVVEGPNGKSKWYAYKDYTSDYKLTTFGKMSITSIATEEGDGGKKISGSDISDENGVLDFTVNIKPYSELLIRIKVNGFESENVKSRDLYDGDSKKYVYLRDSDYFLNVVSTAQQGGYGSSVAEYTSSSFSDQDCYDNYAPHNTVLIKNTMMLDTGRRRHYNAFNLSSIYESW